ncbi:MAG: FAD-dependent oxidoreductase [Proteobacteria bacterium]|nr:FAD-dependent oxidoreductase [Pseudomonadota bacterium]
MAEPWDVIIVGAGTTGMPAAIFAAQRGARVLILEAAPEVGGTLHLSAGQMSAAGSRLQAEKGIEDTPDEHYDDCMRISNNTADPVLVRLAVDNAADTLDWLQDIGAEIFGANRGGHAACAAADDDEIYTVIEALVLAHLAVRVGMGRRGRREELVAVVRCKGRCKGSLRASLPPRGIKNEPTGEFASETVVVVRATPQQL